MRLGPIRSILKTVENVRKSKLRQLRINEKRKIQKMRFVLPIGRRVSIADVVDSKPRFRSAHGPNCVKTDLLKPSLNHYGHKVGKS